MTSRPTRKSATKANELFQRVSGNSRRRTTKIDDSPKMKKVVKIQVPHQKLVLKTKVGDTAKVEPDKIEPTKRSPKKNVASPKKKTASPKNPKKTFSKFYVEKILEHASFENLVKQRKVTPNKQYKSQIFYRVRWINWGPDKDTWEPEENLNIIKNSDNKILEEYQKKHNIGKFSVTKESPLSKRSCSRRTSIRMEEVSSPKSTAVSTDENSPKEESAPTVTIPNIAECVKKRRRRSIKAKTVKHKEPILPKETKTFPKLTKIVMKRCRKPRKVQGKPQHKTIADQEPVTNVEEPILLDLTEEPIFLDLKSPTAAIDGISNKVGEIVDLVSPKPVDEDNEKDTDIEILEDPASLPKEIPTQTKNYNAGLPPVEDMDIDPPGFIEEHPSSNPAPNANSTQNSKPLFAFSPSSNSIFNGRPQNLFPAQTFPSFRRVQRSSINVFFHAPPSINIHVPIRPTFNPFYSRCRESPTGPRIEEVE
uniref:Chromo domain-containing protein n=1 Tax=Acrobeloides nanus TaxID=290746 RepID=A0A914CW57_9BILA